MRRRFTELKEHLEEFVYQDEAHTLVLTCGDAEAAYALKAVEALDAENTSDLFFNLVEPFDEASRWVTRSTAALRALFLVLNHQRTRASLAPLPGFPALCEDARYTPRERLFALVQYLRSMLPDEDGHRLVVSFLPTELRDPAGYASLMASLIPAAEPPDWTRAVRLVVRDPSERPTLAAAFRARGVAHVLTLPVDLSTASVTDALTRDAADPAVPEGERMSALLQLAMLDFAYHRHGEATRKFGVLHDYYAAHDARAMQALCLHGVGDVLRDGRRVPEALGRYQQAVATAMEARALPVLLNALMAAGDTSMELGRFEDAQSYFASAADTAGAMLNPFARCDALERVGDAALARRRHDDVSTAWERCASLATECGHGPRLESVRARMEAWRGAASREVHP